MAQTQLDISIDCKPSRGPLGGGSQGTWSVFQVRGGCEPTTCQTTVHLANHCTSEMVKPPKGKVPGMFGLFRTKEPTKMLEIEFGR